MYVLSRFRCVKDTFLVALERMDWFSGSRNFLSLAADKESSESSRPYCCVISYPCLICFIPFSNCLFILNSDGEML